MDGLRVDDVRALLPELPELAPLMDRVISGSVPDPDRIWAGSGALGTMGQRLVDGERLPRDAPELAAAHARRIAAVYTHVAEAIAAMAGGNREGAARALLEACEVEEGERPDRALAYALAAHRAVQSLPSLPLAPLTLRRAARAARSLGRLSQSASLYEEAWTRARAAGDLENAVVAAVGRGNVAVDRGAWREGEDWYRRALEELPDTHPPLPARWHVQQNLGIVLREQGDLAGSRVALEEAERVAGILQDPAAAVEVVNGWGQLLAAEGNREEAEARFREALAAATHPGARAAILVGLGELLLEMDRTRDALEAARGAEEAAILGAPARLPEVYRLLGRVALREMPDHAFLFFQRALEVIRERGLPEFERALTLEGAAECRLQEGEEEMGRALLREALTIHGELGMEGRRGSVARRLEELEKGTGTAGAEAGGPLDEEGAGP